MPVPPLRTISVPLAILLAFIFVIGSPSPVIVPDTLILPETTTLSVIFVVVPTPTFPTFVILNTVEPEEFITLNILLVFSGSVCFTVKVEFVLPPYITSNLSVVYTSVFNVVVEPCIVKLQLTIKLPSYTSLIINLFFSPCAM